MIRRIASRRLTHRGWRIVAVGLVLIVGAGAAIMLASPARRPQTDSASPPVVAGERDGVCRRPYAPGSPWNTPIGDAPRLDPRSAPYIDAIAAAGKPLTSDPDQYATAVYRFDDQTPRRTVKLSGYFSSYDDGDDAREGHGFAPRIAGIPIPEQVKAPPGDDGQVVLWNPDSGVEYAFFQYGSAGAFTATNGYRYRTSAGSRGRFADGLAGRGAGLPYLGGLVRPCEIRRRRIDHALAFAYDAPSPAFVYPASKSDGTGSRDDPPEGARLQLDPALGQDDFATWGLSPEAQTIARALQAYGMYIVDNSGSSKLFLEARITARWPSFISRDMVSAIPWAAFRVVRPPSLGR